MNIKTFISDYAYVWGAYDADLPEDSPTGWGLTEKEAIADLHRQLRFEQEQRDFIPCWEHDWN